jgi:gluconokinase
MLDAMPTKVFVLMGVSGSGKTTIGELLARRLGWPYADADSFHSAENVAKMASGHPLSDDDRRPWLQAIRTWIDDHLSKDQPGVTSCSALKRSYRDLLRGPGVSIVYLRGTRAEIESRVAARKGHYFKLDMVESQFAALEEPGPDEDVITVSISKTPDEVVASILAAAGIQS